MQFLGRLEAVQQRLGVSVYSLLSHLLAHFFLQVLKQDQKEVYLSISALLQSHLPNSPWTEGRNSSSQAVMYQQQTQLCFWSSGTLWSKTPDAGVPLASLPGKSIRSKIMGSLWRDQLQNPTSEAIPRKAGSRGVFGTHGFPRNMLLNQHEQILPVLQISDTLRKIYQSRSISSFLNR